METDKSFTNVRQLTRDTYALVLAGGRGSRLYELTDWRAKPAVYFGGKFRIIDFPLSNCINSGIRRVGVATQYKSHSLTRHLVRGWSHFKKELREHVELLPASQRQGDNWYKGTADAIYQNLDIIRSDLPKYIMILSGDHIYKMDYGLKLIQHVESGADMTVSCMELPIETVADTFGVIQVNEQNRVIGFEEKPSQPKAVPDNHELALASMGNYIFNTEFLFEMLEKDAANKDSSHDFGNDIIPSIIDDHKIYAYRFKDVETGGQAYWRDVGTLDSFWEANLELVRATPALNLYDEDWPIWTYQEQHPPAKFVFDDDDRRGAAYDSTISGGCIISGATVRQSVVFSNVHIRSYSEVFQSVILPNVQVGRNCNIQRAIVDRGCVLPDGFTVGVDLEDDRKRGFRVTDNGVVLVTPDLLGQRR